MIVKILCLVLVLAITWVWLNRGFFNAFIHMLCTIAAGAIAFAFWEPFAYLIMGFSPDSGFLSFLAYIAWGAALLVPFALALIVLRFATDAFLKNKVSPIGAVDYLGGAICGGITAMITVGMLFIGYGFMPGSGGVRPVDYSAESAGIGSLRRAGGLWIPAEKFTAAFYGQLSTTSLSTGEPLEPPEVPWRQRCRRSAWPAWWRGCCAGRRSSRALLARWCPPWPAEHRGRAAQFAQASAAR